MQVMHDFPLITNGNSQSITLDAKSRLMLSVDVVVENKEEEAHYKYGPLEKFNHPPQISAPFKEQGLNYLSPVMKYRGH